MQAVGCCRGRGPRRSSRRFALRVDDRSSQNPVVVEGSAELLTDRRDLETLLEVENAKYGTDYGMDMLDPAENCAYRVRPTWVFGLRADEFTGSPTRWIFPR